MLKTLKKTIVTTAVLSTIILSQHALAHAHLASAIPGDKAVISESPESLTLTFTEGVESSFSGVDIMTMSGSAVTTGKTTIDSNDNKIVHVALSAPLKAGEYMVDWHVLSVDGHKTQGSYTFTMK